MNRSFALFIKKSKNENVFAISRIAKVRGKHHLSHRGRDPVLQFLNTDQRLGREGTRRIMVA